ncbi:F0F1 ATP synthase subunit B [Candidatus Daviesbacteria bacterium]|nr:F0F1 ATP synthase subunit B [Candidatus Daviesbacteria bacterium]
MEKILSDFGVQPVLLLAQIVNFLVLLWILNKLLYKPILKVLEERKAKIEKGLKNAEEIEKRLAQTAEEEEKAILAAAKMGEKIIKQAQDMAIQLIDEGKVKAESLADQVLQRAKEQALAEREQIKKEVREHLAGFVMLALEKVTGKVVTKDDQRKMIEDTVRKM